MKIARAALTAMTASSSSNAATAAYQQRISSLATAIQPKVLVPARGSGNYGEQGAAAFYTIDHDGLPAALKQMPSTTTTPLKRVDIDLGPDRLAFYIDDVLTNDEADALAACAEAVLDHNGHSRLAPGIHTPPGMRVNEAAHWYPSFDAAPKLLAPIMDRIRSLVPQELAGMPLHPKFSEKVAQFKYLPGDKFERHIDGLFPGQGANQDGTGVDEWTGVVSGLSCLFYLNDYSNDGLVGGETRLWSADGQRHVDVTPRKGRVLFFRRGSHDAVLHAGLPVQETSQAPKYMALINLAYGIQTGTWPLMSS